MKALVIIPARGGSKGIPEKNSKLLGGKPLIQYTIESALDCFEPAQIIVSTDSEKIREIAVNLGINVPSLRPNHLATDTASSYDVILYCLDEADQNGITYDCVVLLQPTSPFREGAHIKEALELYSSELDMVVSVNESHENPYYSLFEEDPAGFLTKSKEGNFTRRQDCPKVYSYNGAIYMMNPESLRKESLSSFKKVRKYVMDTSCSVDLDTPHDWKLAEFLLLNRS